MDENRMFDLLEKIYIEVQKIKDEVKSNTEKITTIDDKLDRLRWI